jgi:hypothetical protein
MKVRLRSTGFPLRKTARRSDMERLEAARAIGVFGGAADFEGTV